MNAKGSTIVAAALLSGVLSGISIDCGLFGLFGGPGVLFGVLVLLPLCRSMNTSVTCGVLSVFGSMTGYFVAIELFLRTERVVVLCGALGAFFAACPLLLTTRCRSFGLIYVVPTGALAGYLADLTMTYPPGNDFWLLKMLGVMVIWQVSVALSLLSATRRSGIDANPADPRRFQARGVQ
jgi:hypothetical protein